jgi:hypothetical protein
MQDPEPRAVGERTEHPLDLRRGACRDYMHIRDYNALARTRQLSSPGTARTPWLMGLRGPAMAPRYLRSDSEVNPAAPEPAEREAQSRGVLERREHVTVDMDLNAVPVQALVRCGVLRDLERPDRAAFDPSSAVHDRLERNAQHPTPGTDVVPHFRGLEVSLAHDPSMPEAEPCRRPPTSPRSRASAAESGHRTACCSPALLTPLGAR